MNKVAPQSQILTLSEAPLSEADHKKKERDESVAALREFFKELFRYLFTLFCFTLAIFLDSNWSQKHSELPQSPRSPIILSFHNFASPRDNTEI
jgi:hypothetical protein